MKVKCYVHETDKLIVYGKSSLSSRFFPFINLYVMIPGTKTNDIWPFWYQTWYDVLIVTEGKISKLSSDFEALTVAHDSYRLLLL